VRVVVALGGNAIQSGDGRATAAQQRRTVREACEQLAEVAIEHEVILTHGNGPQVGAMMIQQRRAELEVPPMPLDVLDAQTQGQIGYLLTQQLGNALRARGSGRRVATLLTQVVVDPRDPAFLHPTKPVGPRYTETELAFRVERKTDDEGIEPDAVQAELTVDGETYRRVDGGMWRRVVPSPEPVDIVEAEAIRVLLDAGVIPVCAGGGGCPVGRDGDELRGVEAVVDKDRTAALVARLVRAQALVILTDVDHVMRDYGTRRQRPLEHLSVSEARDLLAAGQFPDGSMGPKVEAAARVAEHGGTAVITSLGSAADALRGNAGTRITA
jgi:carbamate kinase